MNTKLILIGVLLLVGLTFSGCVWYGGHGYGHGSGYYGYSHDHAYGDRGDWDRGRHGSDRGPRQWR